MDLNALITGAQAARLVGVSRQLVHDWHKTGRLPKTDDGRYRVRDVLNAERIKRRSPHSHRKTATAQ